MTISNKFSKTLRKNSTETEKIMWHYLRNKKFLGYKFRRQFTIGNYIVDFICLEKNLVIELDGSEHLETESLEYDKKRTEFLNQRGLKVIRFYNNDIFNNIDSVLECLKQELVSPSSGFQPPSPLKGEGLGNDNQGQDIFTPTFSPPRPKGERVEFLGEGTELRNSGEGFYDCFKDSVSPSSGFQPPSPPKGEGLENNDQGQDIFTLKGEGLGNDNQGQDIFTPKGEGLENDNYRKNIFNSKKQLRKWAKEVRSKLDTDALSKTLSEKLKETEEYKNAKNIMIFYPLKDEVNLLPLTEDKTKNFYLPKIDGENLLCCKYDENTELCESCFHTMEPVNTQISESIDLIIVPALAVDKNNYRLGYGKGFYDRFLRTNKENNQSFKTIVCIPKELLAETIFPNEYDIPVDLVITD